MTEQNPRAVIGANNPPDPIETVMTEWAETIELAQTCGKVENEAQMIAVDEILKDFKSYKSALVKAGKERTDPLHKAWKAEVAAVKVYTDDADRIQGALVACLAPFKEKLAAEKRAAERAAWEATEKARREAEAAAAKAQAEAHDVDALRAAEEARQAAIDAEKAAKAAKKAAPKGMRTVTHYEITDHRALINWIARNAREDLTAFIEEWARRNHKPDPKADGLRVWTKKEAY